MLGWRLHLWQTLFYISCGPLDRRYWFKTMPAWNATISFKHYNVYQVLINRLRLDHHNMIAFTGCIMEAETTVANYNASSSSSGTTSWKNLHWQVRKFLMLYPFGPDRDSDISKISWLWSDSRPIVQHYCHWVTISTHPLPVIKKKS